MSYLALVCKADARSCVCSFPTLILCSVLFFLVPKNH